MYLSGSNERVVLLTKGDQEFGDVNQSLRVGPSAPPSQPSVSRSEAGQHDGSTASERPGSESDWALSPSAPQ
eukprot:CAMPEP_0184318074 /NCGR_PEP_ID=MMETSP1049-20130417/100399_1 /TAXON_ID=77928 /ORGANISM="Proteomonas sulcata, Strain CCMP704" /LENGTH=71 /DNA_ID=CAMNT_0026637697 /DNA_START=126 /DNA_END=338 /DNA_ORIENTATION=-